MTAAPEPFDAPMEHLLADVERLERENRELRGMVDWARAVSREVDKLRLVDTDPELHTAAAFLRQTIDDYDAVFFGDTAGPRGGARWLTR